MWIFPLADAFRLCEMRWGRTSPAPSKYVGEEVPGVYSSNEPRFPTGAVLNGVSFILLPFPTYIPTFPYPATTFINFHQLLRSRVAAARRSSAKPKRQSRINPKRAAGLFATQEDRAATLSSVGGASMETRALTVVIESLKSRFTVEASRLP